MKCLILLAALLCAVNVYAAEVEVLHWWTAKGEVEAQGILEDALLEQNIKWNNFAIVGAGGESAVRVLQMRALSGNPPDVAHIKGPDIGEWAKVGMLENIGTIADTSVWPEILPKIVRETVTFDGKYMAVPINIHRVNWLWLNKAIFDELSLPLPTTWEEFFANADKIQAAGYIAIAHGGTAWQDALLFESMALSLLGAEKYKQAFVEYNEAVLTSPEMIYVFEQFKRLHQYTDINMRGKDWYQASQLISNNKAGMQFMGDWAMGMWNTQGKKAMVDYICIDVPESKGLFSYNIDSFVFFEKNGTKNSGETQRSFVNILLSEKFQAEFNLAKGSIPVRRGINMDKFNQCAHKSFTDFNNGQLVPSFTQNLASTSHLQNIISKIISNYFNNPSADAATTVNSLSLAIRAIKN
ncbi:carbohydrate ABC transporter substrate-binding protein, CUT1 family [Psychromonas ingrahamii 37]|uniref:Probable sugar-binding periplasmic protein n=1 Tax=Psychromonas ingrahamii (strain DSM 17664 / CCUG 51855 / 37) TaxID=357804 RepID=A1SX10_PSYIN|nr:ABC transporter substrate-binding protein [Psychromonas ingrahamii]ABM04025.1 carbohydrate ABC transporter substrate-binding protein, CUT1 family [Psychromonas ingrahamii 37]